jgi:hypothetical protein
MRHTLTIVTVAVLTCGFQAVTLADDRTEAKSATSAAASNERLAETPNAANSRESGGKLQQLQAKPRTESRVGNAAAAGTCPFGGPGLGYGRGRGGQGYGAGYGPGGRYGRGGGAGFGRGYGPGAGRGCGSGCAAFIDQDNDGRCDFYQERHGLHN